MRRTWRRYWPIAMLLVFAGVVVAVQVIAERRSREADQSIYPNTNYSPIDDGLCMGGYLGEAPPGTRTVLNLSETKDQYEAEVHRWVPIPDGPAPSIDWLREQVAFIDEQHRAGRPVYVHCQAGASRSGMVVTAYVMARDGCSRDEALAYVRQRRPVLRPNPGFMRLLLEWEKVVKRTKDTAPQTP